MSDKLNEISKPDYYNKPFSTRCMISGKSLVPYHIPKRIWVECKGSKPCKEGCNYTEGKEVTVEAIDEFILTFIDMKTSQMIPTIKQACKVSCPSFNYNVKEMQCIERIFISQLLGKDRNKWGTARVAYYIGHDLDVNTVYDVKGYTTVDPMNQSVTHVLKKVERVDSDIESFKITPKIAKRLKKFRPRDGSVKGMFKSLRTLYRSYAHNVTKIYGENRFLLHLSVDLVFHSVLSFDFDGEHIHKGWADTLVIGDPRCGKGYVTENLVKYFGVGEVFGADNSSLAGLVAGLQQYGKQWVVTWGKIPMNDCGLVAIDEAGELRPDVWSKLSRIRSEGVAEVVKIQTYITSARTRMIFLANPPHRTISTYSYGVQAMLDIVKTPEDVARFDYVCVVAHDDVPTISINEPKTAVSEIHSKQSERELIMWMWSRKSNQIRFSKEAIAAVYKYSISLANEYDYSIPLIQGENIRIKLAKLAICFAGRFFSSSSDNKGIIVKREHVKCAVVFLNLLYKSESNGYYIYSKLFKSSDPEATKKSLTVVEKYFKTYANYHEIYRCLLMMNSITLNEIYEFLGKDRQLATEVISLLIRQECLIKKRGYYVKAPFFTKWLKQMIGGTREYD